MAWTDSCKIEAVNQVEHFKKQGMGVREAIQHLSKESDIPYDTLERWVYPRRTVVKNDHTKAQAETELTDDPEWQEPPVLNPAEQAAATIRERNLKEMAEKTGQINQKAKEVEKEETRTDENFISAEMESLFGKLKREIQGAKKDRWRTTSRNAALHHLQQLETIVMSK